MKKELILVGNKPDIVNISSLVDSHDYVLRVNRMQNYGLSGTRIDGLYICAWREYLQLSTKETYERTLKAKRIFIEPRHIKFLDMHWKEICSFEQYNHVGLFHFENRGFDRVIENRQPNQVPTSTFKLLDYLLNTPQWMDNYNITITGIDINNRSDLLMNGANWIHTTHKTVGQAEADFIKKQVKLGNIKYMNSGN